MRDELAEPRNLDLSDRTPAARRRRNLSRGFDRWMLATTTEGVPPGPVLLFTLTFEDPDVDKARGAIRDFWHHYRDTFGRRPYFSWVELQRRGALHYHAILVKPPWDHRGRAEKWIKAHWPHDRIGHHLDWRTKQWFIARGGAYVKQYAKAPNKRRPAGDPPVHGGDKHQVDKSYQQDYEQLPRSIRTYENNALSWYVDDIDQHRDRSVLENRSSAPVGSIEWLKGFWLMQTLHHHPQPGTCTLRRTQKRPRSVKVRGRFTRSRSGAIARHPARK